MHFITGGAFNGKKQWVIKAYQLEEQPHLWHSFYTAEPMKEWADTTIVLEGIERYVRRLAEQYEDVGAARKRWKEDLQKWIDWERKHQKRRLIVIGTDMMKGIVPANPFDRMWRDTVGWCFQDAAESADQVCQIWYGLPQIIKKEEEEI